MRTTLIDMQIILINMQMTLTPLLTCKSIMSQTAWRLLPFSNMVANAAFLNFLIF